MRFTHDHAQTSTPTASTSLVVEMSLFFWQTNFSHFSKTQSLLLSATAGTNHMPRTLTPCAWTSSESLDSVPRRFHNLEPDLSLAYKAMRSALFVCGAEMALKDTQPFHTTLRILYRFPKDSGYVVVTSSVSSNPHWECTCRFELYCTATVACLFCECFDIQVRYVTYKWRWNVLHR